MNRAPQLDAVAKMRSVTGMLPSTLGDSHCTWETKESCLPLCDVRNSLSQEIMMMTIIIISRFAKHFTNVLSSQQSWGKTGDCLVRWNVRVFDQGNERVLFAKANPSTCALDLILAHLS